MYICPLRNRMSQPDMALNWYGPRKTHTNIHTSCILYRLLCTQFCRDISRQIKSHLILCMYTIYIECGPWTHSSTVVISESLSMCIRERGTVQNRTKSKHCSRLSSVLSAGELTMLLQLPINSSRFDILIFIFVK